MTTNNWLVDLPIVPSQVSPNSKEPTAAPLGGFHEGLSTQAHGTAQPFSRRKHMARKSYTPLTDDLYDLYDLCPLDDLELSA